jgi:cell wall-associated NlpC family hydrolase
MPHAPVRSSFGGEPDRKMHKMRSLLTRFRAVTVAAALVVAPTVAVTAAPVAAHAATHRTPARLKALAYAKKQLGDPYRYGAAGPNAFDCSGLTMRAYAKAGKRIGGHSATAQYRTARKRHQLRSIKHVRKGDLLFYGSPYDVYHVAMYVGKGKMIEAPHEGARVRIVKMRKGDLLSKVADPKG